MVKRSLGLALLLLAGGVWGQVPATGSLVADAPAADPAETAEQIAARDIRSRMAVPVMVDGAGPYRFIVDSGADRSVIGAALAERMGLPAGRMVTLHGMAGTGEVRTVTLKTLEVGSNRIRDVTAPALRESYIGAQGLLGIDALFDQRVMLDFVAQRMTVQGPGKPDLVDPDEIVVTARRRFGQLILAQASIDRDRVFAIIDTGAQVTIGNSALRRRVFGGRTPRKAMPITLVGVTGQTTVAEYAILPQIRIGGILLKDVPVAFTDAPPFALFGVARAPAMLLGTDLLKTFRRVSLDFKRKTVRFLLKDRR